MANRGNLARATDSSDAPTPGYLYLDIAKNAASSPSACSEICQYLTRRLESKQNPNVKYKCLKVIAKVAESPVTRGQFKLCATQNAQAVAAIKEALQFRGQPDPARGDERNARVRQAAKEALDAIYSDTPSSSSREAAPYGGGYAASSSVGGGGGVQPGPPVSSGRMQGIGNPMFSDPRHDPQKGGLRDMTIGQVVGVAGETIAGMIKDPLARNVEVPQNKSGMPGYGSGGYGAPPPGSSQLAAATQGQWTMASNRGPNSVNNNSEYYKARDAAGSGGFQWAQQGGGGAGTSSGVGGSWGSVSTAVPSSSTRPSVASQARAAPHGGNYGATATPTTTGSGGTAASDGSFEQKLIMELCPPGGMKAEPPPDKLASFARTIPSLNPDLVCPALLDALEDGNPWIIRAKALCVMEVVIVASERNGIHAYSDFFHACRGEIEPLANHARAAVRDPAKRVLKALGIEESAAGVPAAAPPASAPPVAPPAAPVPNLLDFDDDEPTPPAAAAPSVPPPAAPAAAPPSAGSSSLFGGMQVKQSTPPPAAAPPAAPPAPSLFGDVQVKDNNNTTTTASATAAAEAQDVGKAAAIGGSAFGFINGGGGATAPAKAEEPKKPPPPTKESFDPLLSLGATNTNHTTSAVSPTTAQKQAMQLSTAQMQAMAYQQMMMQQQVAQMQQMQMAMAMQGGGSMSSMPPPNLHRHVIMNSMNSSGANASSSFSFLDVGSKPPPKEDKKFDFVKDAFKEETKK